MTNYSLDLTRCPAGPLVFNAIRAVHPTTPILIFGGMYICPVISHHDSPSSTGHTHIRDCGKPISGHILVGLSAHLLCT